MMIAARRGFHRDHVGDGCRPLKLKDFVDKLTQRTLDWKQGVLRLMTEGSVGRQQTQDGGQRPADKLQSREGGCEV